MQTSVGSQWNCSSLSKGWIWNHVLQALRDLLPIDLICDARFMVRLKLPKNSTSLTLYQHSIYPTEKCPLSQECSNGGHHSSQGAQLSLWWRYKVQKEALCPHKGPSEWLPEGAPEWEGSQVLRARLKHCKGVHNFLSHGRSVGGLRTSGGRGLAFLTLLICLLTGHLRGFW